MRKKRFSGKIVLILAIFSFIVAMIEGSLYYTGNNVFFNTLLILQNGINAFMFKPSISISDAIEFIDQNKHDAMYTVIGYLYGIAVFTAPYCTIATVYKIMESLLRVMVNFSKKKKWHHIMIFGYNNDIKTMLENYTADKQKEKLCIHIITDKPMSADLRFELGKNGCVTHCFDLLQSKEKEIDHFLRKVQADIADKLILFDENSVTNFSVLQIFSCREGDGRFSLKDGAKITCRCDDDNIAELIAGHYNSFGGQCLYDLDIISIPELQVRKMYETTPLHKYYYNTDTNPDKWDARILILGFGALGRQALIQAIEQGVVSKNNKIEIHIYDTSIGHKFELFANRFSLDTFDWNGNELTLKGCAADGRLRIICHETNVMHKGFYEHIKSEMSKQLYTYVFIAIDNTNLSVGCALRISRLFDEYGVVGVPIVLRMDTDRRLAEYINKNTSDFANVKLLEDRASVLTLENIISERIDKAAKEFHYFYSTIQVLPKGGKPWDIGNSDINELWKKNSMFKRRSSKALAAHSNIKRIVFERLAKQTDSADVKEKISELIGKEGSLMHYTNGSWVLNADEDGFLEALQKDSFALAVAELEHRRWCYFVAADGWRYDKKRNDKLKAHDCLMTFDALLDDPHGRGTIMYDLMPIMALFLEDNK